MVKKIAVTGGSGFLGAATVRMAREHGHRAWSFDQRTGGDVLGSLDALRDADTVIHLAGVLGTSELFQDPENALDVNVKGTLRVLDWCRQNDAGFVGITMPEVFPSVYTATKVSAHLLSDVWRQSYGVPVSYVKAFNAFGPGQAHGPGHPQKIVPTFSRCGWENEPLPIWGDGSQTMDLVYVDDVARVLVEAVGFGDGQVFDAGTGTAVTVNEFADFVLQVTNSSADVKYFPMRLGETPTQIVARGDGWNLLSWRPRFDWSDVEKTVRAYKNA